MAKQRQEPVPKGFREAKKRSALPFYAAAVLLLLYSLFFPLYKPVHYILPCLLATAVFVALEILLPKKSVLVPDNRPPAPTGDADADRLLREGRTQLIDIHTSAAGIVNSSVRAEISDIEATSERIFSHLCQHPDCAPSLRRFMSYYLPTVKKLVESYSMLERQGVRGENIDGSMRRIEEMLVTVDSAFKKQLDALFADLALDLGSDMTVMEGFMEREGLNSQNAPSKGVQ